MGKLDLGQADHFINQFGCEDWESDDEKTEEENWEINSELFLRDYNKMVAEFGEENLSKLYEINVLAQELYEDGVKQKDIIAFVSVAYPQYRLHITSDYRILLPDFDNAEIKLAPATKALYFLFLRHVHGLRRKEDLPDCKEELLELYNMIQEPTKRGTEPIEKLTDITTSAFDDSCNRIKKEFLKYMDEHDAKWYYISGGQNQLKGIMMSRYYLIVD